MPALRFKFFLLFALYPLSCFPDSSVSSSLQETDVSALLAQAEEKRLADEAYWLGLMHYKKDRDKPFNVESEIISPDFFLSPNGRHDPHAELQATLRAFFLPPTENPDEHPQCRFIARFHWLKGSLNWEGLIPPEVHCKTFQAWVSLDRIESLSLVFATGYLSSPASFYGHILLKVNSLDDTAAQIDLLNQSVNYGAIVPENEPALIYVYQGLFGGYEAGFSHDVFYRHNHNYVENELRDLWEYELNLSKEQIDQILFHTWELLGKKFKYFFLDKNCAYHMANLLDLVINEEINYDHDIFSIPVTLFNRLDTINNLGSPILGKIKYIPSRQSRFFDHMKMLNTSQQSLALKIVTTDEPIGNTLSTLPEGEQIKVADTLIEYYEFRSISDNDATLAKQRKHELLVWRTGLPASDDDNPDNMGHNQPPTKGPLPTMLQVGWERNDILGAGTHISGRLSYYDLIDLESGLPPNSHVSALDVRFTAHHDELIFRSFDILHVQNLNVSRTGLPGDGGMAWKVRAYIENHDLDCNYCGDFNLTGGIGKGAYFSEETVLFAMGDLNMRLISAHESTLTFTPYLGILGSPAPQWKSALTLGYQYDLGEGGTGVRHIAWNNRFGAERDWNIRINYRLLEYKEISALFSLYW